MKAWCQGRFSSFLQPSGAVVLTPQAAANAQGIRPTKGNTCPPYPSEVLTPERLNELEPGLHRDPVRSDMQAAAYPSEGWVEPVLVTKHLLSTLPDVRYSCTVVGMTPIDSGREGPSWQVDLSTGERLAAHTVVIAAGIRSAGCWPNTCLLEP